MIDIVVPLKQKVFFILKLLEIFQAASIYSFSLVLWQAKKKEDVVNESDI